MSNYMSSDKTKQELFTISVFESLGYCKGFKFIPRNSDFGIDADVCFLVANPYSDRTRLVESSQKICIQHKSTSYRSINKHNTVIKYPLEVKTYNDMLMYRDYGQCLVLILSILTNDTWTDCCDDHNKYFSKAYWYIIDDDAKPTDNTATITISIPIENKFDIDTLGYLFKLIHKVEVPDAIGS